MIVQLPNQEMFSFYLLCMGSSYLPQLDEKQAWKFHCCTPASPASSGHNARLLFHKAHGAAPGRLDTVPQHPTTILGAQQCLEPRLPPVLCQPHLCQLLLH